MERNFQKIINLCFHSLFVVVPLIFTPWNSELFEFNKILAVYAITSIIVGAWIGRMILQKRIIFTKTPFDLPLLLFLSSQLLSSIFSLDRHTSFWGYYSRFHGGLLSTFCYLLLYWAFVSNIKKKTALFIIRCSLFTALLISLYGIAEHYGIDAQLWVQDVRNRVFSTLGQPNWLAAYLAVLLPTIIGFSLTENKKISSFKSIIHYSSFFILALCFFYTKSQSGLLSLIFSLLIFWLSIFFLNLKRKSLGQKVLWQNFLIFSLIFFACFGRVGLSAFPQITSQLEKLGLVKRPSLITESQLSNPPPYQTGGEISSSGEIRKVVWKGAIEIFKHYPILGSGVETFAYSYYNFRPREHNLLSEWDFLYNKAHNEYLNFLATTGIIGLGTYLLFIGWFILWSLKMFIIYSIKLRKTGAEENFTFYILIFALFTGWLSILVTNFFGFSVVVVALFFFLIPAFCFVLYQPESSSSTLLTNHLSTTTKIYLLALLFFVFYLLSSIVNLWRADYYYALGEKNNKAGQYPEAFKQLSAAINLNPGEPVYRNEIAEAAASLTLVYLQEKNTQTASDLAQIAILQSEQALKISPRDLNFWKSQTKIYYLLAQADKNYLLSAVNALREAIKLAPTDAKLVYNLGVIYSATDQSEAAIAAFRQTIDLKPDYRDARFALAVYLKEKNQLQGAKNQLEYILKNLAPGDSPSAKLLREISK